MHIESDLWNQVFLFLAEAVHFPFPEPTAHTSWAFQPQHRDFVSMCWTEKWSDCSLNSATFNLGNFKWIHSKSLLWENFKSSRGLCLFIRWGDNTYFLRPLWRLGDIICLKIFECFQMSENIWCSLRACCHYYKDHWSRGRQTWVPAEPDLGIICKPHNLPVPQSWNDDL